MEPEALFTDISHFVSESRELLKSGAMMELAGLDKRVCMLCDEVLRLSGDERTLYAERLQQLWNDLDSLGRELTAQRDQVARAIQCLPQHKKANVAYRIVEASGRKEEGDE